MDLDGCNNVVLKLGLERIYPGHTYGLTDMADDGLLHPGFAPTPGVVEKYGDDGAGKVV